MKRCVRMLVVLLVVVLSAGAVYGQKLDEVTVKGTIPTEWGNLRSVVVLNTGTYRLFFEDSKGTIRTTVYALEDKTDMSAPAVWVVRGAAVIKRK